MQDLQENLSISTFLKKLWKMVNDPSIDHLICWSPAGNTFVIQNQTQFWYELVPIYFRHNNMSSFVRQLNLYGFHKINSLDNPDLPDEKDDNMTMQFYHPYFQKDKPEKLKLIKRKARICFKPPHHDAHRVIQHDDLNKVLTDVKQLRGRQSSVDSQLSAMKQENAGLWRELAMLRQKHMKQQQIVNKLIQFLVTLVQPSASPRMGVGVKRRMPLMLPENPAKRVKARKSGRQYTESGPTIHELDPEVEFSPEQLLEEASVIEEDNIPLIDSPVTPSSKPSQDSIISQSATSPMMPNQNIPNMPTNQQELQNNNSSIWDKPEFVSIEDSNNDDSDNEEDLINTLQTNTEDSEKVFLNPNNRGALIGSLASPVNYNLNALSGKSIENTKEAPNKQIANASRPLGMQVATKNLKITSGEDLDLHLGNTQNELDQLKDILNGCNSSDANNIFALFNECEPDYGIKTSLQNRESPEEGSGIEVAPAPSLIDFTELFDDDDDLNSQDGSTIQYKMPSQTNGLNTPLIIKNEPKYPTNT